MGPLSPPPEIAPDGTAEEAEERSTKSREVVEAGGEAEVDVSEEKKRVRGL